MCMLFYSSAIARGRKPKVSLEVQGALFRKYAADLDNRLIPYNDPIFSAMSKELDYNMTPMALYLSYKRHRSNTCRINLTEVNIKTSNDESSTCSSVNTNKNLLLIKKTFSFDLDVYEWKKIQPLDAYKKRFGTSTYKKYKTLPKYTWSNMIKSKIWMITKLPCTWTLKKDNIYDDHINLSGQCSQCRAIIKIYSLKKNR